MVPSDDRVGPERGVIDLEDPCVRPKIGVSSTQQPTAIVMSLAGSRPAATTKGRHRMCLLDRQRMENAVRVARLPQEAAMKASPGLMTVLQAVLAITSAGPLLAQSSQTLSVSAHMDIWQSGGYSDGSGGVAPAAYTFPAAPGQTLTFSSAPAAGGCHESFARVNDGPSGSSGSGVGWSAPGAELADVIRKRPHGYLAIRRRQRWQWWSSARGLHISRSARADAYVFERHGDLELRQWGHAVRAGRNEHR